MLLGVSMVVMGYLLGSIPTGVILAKKLAKIDPRAQGSRNIGATNVYRTAGKILGILTLAGDAAKGIIPLILVKYLMKDLGMWLILVALATFLGHLYSIFLGFSGGKGVATASGIYLVISPASFLAALAIFLIVVIKWRYVSLGSLSAASAIPFAIFFFTHSVSYTLLSICMCIMIFLKHRENIQRIIAGTEGKIS